MAKRKTGISRDEAIELLVDDMQNWDFDTVENYAIECLREALNKYSNIDLANEVNGVIDNDSDYVILENTKAKKLLY